MSQVLGISITDLEIASVVADAGTGEVLARNFVELTGPGPGLAFDAIYQLVESAPITASAITIACSDSGIQLAIADIITAGVVPDFLLPPNPEASGAAPKPDWFSRTAIVGVPVAFAEVAARQSGSRGVVVVADLDPFGALFPGQSVALVDTETRSVVGASASSPLGDRLPVTEPDGAQTIADAISVIPGSTGGTFGVLVVGPGAQIPGVAPSLEYGLQLPVQIADDAQYATARGAAMVAAAAIRGSGDNTRWVLLSAAAGAALLLAVGVIVAVVMTGGRSDPDTAVNENPASIVSDSSSSKPVTTSKGKSRISSPTMVVPEITVTTEAPPPPPPPPTRTVTSVPPPVTVTQTPPPVTSTSEATSPPSEEPDPADPEEPNPGESDSDDPPAGGTTNP